MKYEVYWHDGEGVGMTPAIEVDKDAHWVEVTPTEDGNTLSINKERVVFIAHISDDDWTPVEERDNREIKQPETSRRGIN